MFMMLLSPKPVFILWKAHPMAEKFQKIDQLGKFFSKEFFAENHTQYIFGVTKHISGNDFPGKTNS